VNTRKNARMTAYGRALLVRRVLDRGWTAKAAAASVGASGRTVRKGIARYRVEGAGGLADRSSRRRGAPGRSGEGWRRPIVRLRRLRPTAAEIAAKLGLARSTVAAALVRLGLNRLSALSPRAPVVRRARARPGGLIHLDVKKLARLAKPGHRVTATRRGQNGEVGWELVDVRIDDHARLVHVATLDDETGDTCARLLARAGVAFARAGVTVRRVMTDNGTGYRGHRLRRAGAASGLRHLLTRPYSPKTDGPVGSADIPPRDRPRPMAERFIKSLLEGWAHAVPYRSSANRRRELPRRLRRHNDHRPHSAIGGQPPAARLRARVSHLLGTHS
jgi:transposase InsO family protein